MKRPATVPAPDELETGTDDAIAACGGDARSAVRVLLVTVHQLQAELDTRDDEMALLAVHISRGYSRGRRDRYLVRTKVAPPDGA